MQAPSFFSATLRKVQKVFERAEAARREGDAEPLFTCVEQLRAIVWQLGIAQFPFEAASYIPVAPIVAVLQMPGAPAYRRVQNAVLQPRCDTDNTLHKLEQSAIDHARSNAFRRPRLLFACVMVNAPTKHVPITAPHDNLGHIPFERISTTHELADSTEYAACFRCALIMQLKFLKKTADGTTHLCGTCAQPAMGVLGREIDPESGSMIDRPPQETDGDMDGCTELHRTALWLANALVYTTDLALSSLPPGAIVRVRAMEFSANGSANSYVRPAGGGLGDGSRWQPSAYDQERSDIDGGTTCKHRMRQINNIINPLRSFWLKRSDKSHVALVKFITATLSYYLTRVRITFPDGSVATSAGEQQTSGLLDLASYYLSQRVKEDADGVMEGAGISDRHVRAAVRVEQQQREEEIVKVYECDLDCGFRSTDYAAVEQHELSCDEMVPEPMEEG